MIETVFLLTTRRADCYEAFERVITAPIRPEDVDQILNRFQGPFLQKWLSYVPLAARESASEDAGLLCPELRSDSAEMTPFEDNGSTDVFRWWEDFVVSQD